MIGVRSGLACGLRAGFASSLQADNITAAGWTIDAAASKGVPSSSSEWSTVMAAAGMPTKTPSLLIGLQDASGNPADSIGTFVLTASGTGLAYQQPVTGWSRKAITTTDGGTGTLTNTDAGLPDLSTTSFLVMVYEQLLSAPGATRSSITLGTTVVDAEYTTTPRIRQVCGANNLIGTVDPTGAVRCRFVRLDRTAGNSVLYTSQEKVTPTFGATATGKRLKLGAAGASSPPAAYLYCAGWFGAAAEMTDAQIKTLAGVLGWTLP